MRMLACLICLFLPLSLWAQDGDCADLNTTVTSGYSDAGSALVQLSTLVDQLEPGDLSLATAAALENASIAFQNLADQLEQLAANNPQITEETIAGYASMANLLHGAAMAQADGDAKTAHQALSGFAELLSDLVGHSFTGAPEVQAAFKNAAQHANDAAGMASFADPSAGQKVMLDLFAQVLAAVDGPVDELTASAQTILALKDPALRQMFDLQDEETLEALGNIAGLVADPEAMEGFAQMRTNPAGYASVLAGYGLAETLGQLGGDLTMASALMSEYGEMALCGGCPDECESDADCAGCTHCATGIGTGLSNPKDLKDINLTLEIITRAPRMTPGAGGGVRKAMKGLINILKQNRPTLWIKVCWEKCESVRCWVFWHHKVCVAYESDWIEVPEPNGLPYWPPVSSWSNPGTARSIERAVDKAVRAACAGK